jgi:hypothetical protein
LLEAGDVDSGVLAIGMVAVDEDCEEGESKDGSRAPESCAQGAEPGRAYFVVRQGRDCNLFDLQSGRGLNGY